jgi:hypothetical protein
MARVLARSTIHLGGWGQVGTVGMADEGDPRFGYGLEKVREGDFTREQLDEIVESLSIPAGDLASKDAVITEVEKTVRKRDADTA